MTRNNALAAVALTLLLLAGCTSTPTVAPATAANPGTSTNSAASSASASRVLSSGGTASSGGAASSGSGDPVASSASSGSSGPGSVPVSPTPVSSAPRSSASVSPVPVSSAPVSSAPVSPAAVLDAASTRWLTTYCTTILPVTTLTAMQSQISAASGDMVKIQSLFVQAFRTSGGAMTATVAALKGQTAPALTAAGSDLPGLLSRIGTLGAKLTADEAKLGAIDPVGQSVALGHALATYGPDIDQISTVLGTGGGLKLPVASLAEVGKIAACKRVITTS